jgi:LemA protein
MVVFLLIVIAVSVLAIIYINSYNDLQYLKTNIEQAESIIDDSLRTKYDLIAKANTIVKKELKSKKEYFKGLKELKDKKISNFDFDRALIEYQSTLNDLISDHEKLSNNKDLNNIIYEIKSEDERLVSSKDYYNKNTTESNHLIRKFPSLIIAKILHYKVRPYFDGKNMQDEDIEDFKL